MNYFCIPKAPFCEEVDLNGSAQYGWYGDKERGMERSRRRLILSVKRGQKVPCRCTHGQNAQMACRLLDIQISRIMEGLKEVGESLTRSRASGRRCDRGRQYERASWQLSPHSGSHQVLKLEQGSLARLIEQKARGMHENHTQQAMAQVPDVMCPHALDAAAIGQLTENGIHQRANPTQDGTKGRGDK